MSSQADSSPPASTPDWLGLVSAWQRGEVPREALTGPLTQLGSDQGETVQTLISGLLARARQVAGERGAGPGADSDASTDNWRAELLACRARTWASPASAGLLVGPTTLLLTDGRQGVVLGRSGLRALPGSVSASLLLLCQTIVMADYAVDAQELGTLRQQRIESTSTSLSEIEPLP